jgi:hypothetical protein
VHLADEGLQLSRSGFGICIRPREALRIAPFRVGYLTSRERRLRRHAKMPMTDPVACDYCAAPTSLRPKCSTFGAQPNKKRVAAYKPLAASEEWLKLRSKSWRHSTCRPRGSRCGKTEGVSEDRGFVVLAKARAVGVAKASFQAPLVLASLIVSFDG